MGKMLLVVVLTLAAAGCETVRPGPRRGYMDPNDDVFGKTDRMEYTQKHLSIVTVFEQMKTDPMFTTQYDAAKKRAADAGRVLPTVAVRPIENNTGDGRSDSVATGQMYREIITQLRKTKLFEVIDYTRRKRLIDTVTSGVDNGNNSDAIQHIGNYTSEDFILTGELKREHADDGDRVVYHHFLNLEMTDTSTGTVFWSDTAQPTVKYE